ncbi:D-Ala-D-Ala dipeptidase [Acidovorax sp. sif1233]|uniref:D-Ala-D-Ala dipeptidase n=1 Tax=Acidovorax sp. sif1233 TaxID=2854792 RepID=UPI001C484B67|nr:D-Ala-D-Ala dipeptidase [Acidovorax sp. sif1233]MBV7455874.1 D-Ala-D-Ala dipeptidase [Acidovorax sp. sif1233]
MHCFAIPAIARPAPAAVPVGTRWSSAALALLLAACVHSPQAAVPPVSSSLPPASHAHAGSGSGCSEMPGGRAALDGVARELQAQGMALEATCPVAAGEWVVRVRVVDGMKASKVVRGPLADGHDVDMGTPAGVRQGGAELAARGFSPDVLHNRQWLRTLMARHEFDNAADAWWRFAQRARVPAPTAETDLAAR